MTPNWLYYATFVNDTDFVKVVIHILRGLIDRHRSCYSDDTGDVKGLDELERG